MKIAFLDGQAGVAGDMWVGALLDGGLPIEALRSAVDRLALPGVRIGAERVRRAGMAATRFLVEVPTGGSPERHLAEVLEVIRRASLPPRVEERAVAVFVALAEAEAAAHGIDVARIHFHEVGAEDSIVDVVCACLGLGLLGVERVVATAIEVGTGTVACAHGVLPVPAPGALANLIGVPVTRTARLSGERTTPTGAALLRVLVDEFEPTLHWIPRTIGCGAGARDDPGFPNLLRITLGDRSSRGSQVAVVELSCHVDTADGETLGWLLDETLRRGAIDAWLHPVHLKKGRPGTALHVLVDGASRDAMLALLLEESTSLGVRIETSQRAVLERFAEVLDGPFGPVRFKSARLPSGDIVRRPEDDEVRRICAETGLGRRHVLGVLLGAPLGGTMGSGPA